MHLNASECIRMHLNASNIRLNGVLQLSFQVTVAGIGTHLFIWNYLAHGILKTEAGRKTYLC